jgi:hypothetical protein
MNLLSFTWRTDWQLAAAPLFFAYGAATNAFDGNTCAALCLLLAGIAVSLAALLGKALHRQRLIVGKLVAWITSVAHNGDLGHLPHDTEAEARAYIAKAMADPVAEQPLGPSRYAQVLAQARPPQGSTLAQVAQVCGVALCVMAAGYVTDNAAALGDGLAALAFVAVSAVASYLQTLNTWRA